MQISELLRQALIKADLESRDKESAIAELLELLVLSGDVTDRDGCYQALLDREDKGTTGIGDGIAVPHAKHESITHLSMALGLSKPGVEFEAIDGEPVSIVFLILAEPDNPGPHVQALAQVARLCQTPGFCQRLRGSQSAQEALGIIVQSEETEE
jgi:mannitol/fructose-specific phosphotransferase system IIA component (Ntr-type)